MVTADVDGDGRDEVMLGSCMLDDNGTLLWSSVLKYRNIVTEPAGGQAMGNVNGAFAPHQCFEPGTYFIFRYSCLLYTSVPT